MRFVQRHLHFKFYILIFRFMLVKQVIHKSHARLSSAAQVDWDLRQICGDMLLLALVLVDGRGGHDRPCADDSRRHVAHGRLLLLLSGRCRCWYTVMILYAIIISGLLLWAVAGHVKHRLIVAIVWYHHNHWYECSGLLVAHDHALSTRHFWVCWHCGKVTISLMVACLGW